jgi:signal transduction histidine kinase
MCHLRLSRKFFLNRNYQLSRQRISCLKKAETVNRHARRALGGTMNKEKEYDIIENLPGGSFLWRGVVVGLEGVRPSQGTQMKSDSPNSGANSTVHEAVDCASILRSLSETIRLLPMAAYMVRAPDGMIVWFNSRAAELWGRTPVLGDTDERFCGAHKLYRSDGSYMAHCDTPVAVALKSGASTYEEPVVIERPDGSRVEVSVHIDPVRDESGTIVGAVNFFRDNTERKQAQQSAIVLQQSQQLRELTNRLQRSQDEERRRIARELHDSAGQSVAALSMNLSAMNKHVGDNSSLGKILQASEEQLQQLAKEIRTISYLLHPPLLDEAGLEGAIRWYVEGLIERSGLNIELAISEDFNRLPNEIELALFRIIQECLTNIHRHSGSKTATIKLLRNAESVSLEIHDQGRGIPDEKLAQIRAQRSGVGLTGMWERVRHFDGVMDIQSNPSGTTISISLPATTKSQSALATSSVSS